MPNPNRALEDFPQSEEEICFVGGEECFRYADPPAVIVPQRLLNASVIFLPNLRSLPAVSVEITVVQTKNRFDRRKP